jgi:hypothetical protein
MSNSVPLRRQLLIDRAVQTPVLQRTALYSVCGALYFMVIMFFGVSADAPDQAWYVTLLQCFDEAVYWAPGIMLLAPVIVYDILTLTNRFVGPVFRLRREMQRLVNQEECFELNFREGDYWTEMADLFNQVREEVLELRESKKLAERAMSGRPEIPAQEKLFGADEEDDEDDSDLLAAVTAATE